MNKRFAVGVILLFSFLFFFVFPVEQVFARGQGGFGLPSFGETISELLSDGVKIGVGVVVALLGAFAAILNLLATAALYIATYLFDITLNIATSGLSQIVNGEARTAIREGWIIVRDLINIGFVFVLLYIAINFILSTDSSSTKKLLSSTILAALLINFSFFFAALVVDISNQLAIELVSSIQSELGEHSSIGTFLFMESGIVQGWDIIKEKFGMGNADAGGIAQLVNDAGSGGASASLFETVIKWGGGSVMSLIMTLVLVVVFVVASFFLIARTIVLVLLLITSPIGFGGYVLPFTKGFAKDWWQSLVAQSFFLPAFILFLLIAMKLINADILGISALGQEASTNLPSLSGAAGGALTQTLVSAAQSLIGVFVKYAIVIGLFLGALVAAKKLSAVGSDVVAKLSGTITSTVGGAALGLTGYAGRNTVGRAANYLAERDKFKEWAASSRIGTYALQGTKYASGASFDARKSRAFTGVASATGVGDKVLGEMNKKAEGGYAGQLKSQREARTTFAADAIGQISDKDKKVEPIKRGLDAALEDLQDLRDSGADPADIKLQRDVVNDLSKKYAEARNANIQTYATRIKNPQKVLGIPMKYAGRKNQDAGKTIEKEIAKAIKDSKYDIVKALKAAKGDKKEE